MNNRSLYLKTKPSKLFMRASILGAISMLASSVYTIFDAVFIGKFVGGTAFAAFGLAFPIVIMNFALADLVGVGVSIPISIFLGKKEDDKANTYFTTAVLMILTAGLVMGILIYIFAPIFMKMMGASGELLELGVDYLRIYALFSPLITIIFSSDNFLRICGKLKISTLLHIGMSFATILFELLFIRVFNMGIKGAALGSCLAMLICAIISMSMLLSNKLQLKFVKPKISKLMVSQILKNGSPAYLTGISGRVFAIIMNIFLLKMGGEGAVITYGILLTIGGLVELLLYGTLDSLQPAIGYNYGAGRTDRVDILQKYCFIAGAVVSICSAIILFAIPSPIISMFLEDSSLLDMGIFAMRLYAISYLIKWISYAIQSFFMAVEKPLPTVILALSSALAFPLIALGVFYTLGLTGLWLNYPLTIALTTILAIFIFVKKKKKVYKEVECLTEYDIKD